MISEILVLSSRDVLIRKTYRPDVTSSTGDIFLREVLEKKAGSLLPHLEIDGIHYFHIKRHQLYVVATSTHVVSSILVSELLSRFYSLLKDFCGVVNEESIQLNFILVNELLDEFMDYGHVQVASTVKLKPYLQSEPATLRLTDNLSTGLFGAEHRVAPRDAANKPVIRSRNDQDQRKNEIFLDVVERLNVLIGANGSVTRCELRGSIVMKSFLFGCPEVNIGLNEEITVAQPASEKGYGTINLDDITFHESVNATSFHDNQMLTIRPPEGEFPLMTYQMQGDLPHGLPFRVYSYVNKTDGARDLEVGLKLRCEIPSSSHAINVTVNVPVPKSLTGFSKLLSGPGQTATWSPEKTTVTWSIKKLIGRSEASAHFKLMGAQESGRASLPEIGPVAVDFEVSGYVCSNLQIRFLRVFDRECSYVPTRWIRYITTADSYLCRLA